jgi:hypothetical protein
MSKEEYLAMLSQALKQVKQPEDIDIAEMQRRIDEQYALIEEMQPWLDHQLKNSRDGERPTKTLATVGGLGIPQDRRLSPATRLCPGHGRLHSARA